MCWCLLTFAIGLYDVVVTQACVGALAFRPIILLSLLRLYISVARSRLALTASVGFLRFYHYPTLASATNRPTLLNL